VLVPADAPLGELHEVINADPSDEEHERILEWPGLENPSASAALATSLNCQCRRVAFGNDTTQFRNIDLCQLVVLSG
jgi:hypothetical protein